MTTRDLLAELRAMHRLATEHRLNQAACWLAAKLPQTVTDDHRAAHARAVAIAPDLRWDPVTTTTEYTAPLVEPHHEYDAWLYVTPDSCTAMITGMKWRVASSQHRTARDQAAELARRAAAYCHHWRQPDSYSLRDLMRFRLHASERLYAVTCWALLPATEEDPTDAR